MQEAERQVLAYLTDLKDLAPAGYAIALHIGFNSPKYMFQTYPAEWRKVYSERGMVLSDPTVHWGLENSGSVRWGDLAHLDYAGVFAEAASMGLKHGVTFSHELHGSRSIASFSKAEDRFSDDDREAIAPKLEDLHKLTETLEDVSDTFTKGLKDAAIMMAHHSEK